MRIRRTQCEALSNGVSFEQEFCTVLLPKALRSFLYIAESLFHCHFALLAYAELHASLDPRTNQHNFVFCEIDATLRK